MQKYASWLEAWKNANENLSYVDADLDLSNLSLWTPDNSNSSYDSATYKINLKEWDGGIIWLDDFNVAIFSELKLTYSDATSDFTFKVIYTDDEENEATVSKQDTSVSIKLKQEKSVKDIQFQAGNEPLSVQLKKLVFVVDTE